MDTHVLLLDSKGEKLGLKYNWRSKRWLQIFFIFLYNGSTGVAVIENSRPAIY